MARKLTCPACAAVFAMAKDVRGKKLFCPSCGASLLGTSAGVTTKGNEPPQSAPARSWGFLLLLFVVLLLVLPAGLTVYLVSRGHSGGQQRNKDGGDSQQGQEVVKRDQQAPLDGDESSRQEKGDAKPETPEGDSKLVAEKEDAETLHRILGHDLHPNPPVAGDPPRGKHLTGPKELFTAEPKPPEIKLPPPDLPSPLQETKLPPPDLPKPPEVKLPPADPPKPPQETKRPPPDLSKPTPAADALFEKRLARSEADLRRELEKVPELRLLSDLEFKSGEEAGKVAALQGRQALSGYLFDVRLQQTLYQKGLKAGLPLRSGPATRLDARSALAVQTVSKELRNLGFVSVPAVSSQIRLPNGGLPPTAKIDDFKKWCDDNQVEKYGGALATLLQMLQIEDEPIRLILVREMAKSKIQGATAVLANRALTDTSAEVRKAAVAALKKRPAAQYQSILLQGFTYPWPPLADHAAEALVTLEAKEAVPQLVKLLDQPDPALPFLVKTTRQRAVREMVRLSHLRNCYLCHPASSLPTDGMIRGIAPMPGQPMPPPYEMGMGPATVPNGNFLRADTIFLRQDFSTNLMVKDAAPWPDEQRFDFVVRQRVLPPAKELETEAKTPNAGFPQREALTYTLRKLTGKDGGDSKEKWEELLFLTKDDKDKDSESAKEK
jgi:hypothetical protein